MRLVFSLSPHVSKKLTNCRCINSRSRRFSNIKDIYNHQYFAEVDWALLRDTKPPLRARARLRDGRGLL